MEAPEVDVCIVTVAEFEKLPPLGVMVGVATVSAKVTLRVNAVVLVTPPPLAVTVMVESPASVDPLVVIFNTGAHVGLQEVELKDAAAPAGRPETLKETG